MLPARIFELISPHASVATAVLPVILAMAARIIWGSNKLTKTLLSACTIWFVVNVVVAPYSEGMQSDIMMLRAKFH